MKNIALFKPLFRKEEILEEISICLDKGWTGIGFKTDEFEKKWCEYTHLKNCHFINSATSGLHLAIKVFKDELGWLEGDEIITPPITFVSTNHSVLYESLVPIFSDIDSSLCLDPVQLEKNITNKTRAIIYVGIGGNASNFKEIHKICKQNNLILILDAAHMAGTKWLNNNLHIGQEADCTVFSYQAVKNCPTSDSGSICFKDNELDKKVRILSWLGISDNTFNRANSKNNTYKWNYDVDQLGFKYNGNSIAAAMAIISLRYLDDDNKIRRQISQKYISAFSSNELINPIIHDKEIISSRHLLQVVVHNREGFLNHMASHGISCGVHYKANNKFSIYEKYNHNNLSYSDSIDNKIVSLPLHLYLSDEDVNFVINTANHYKP